MRSRFYLWPWKPPRVADEVDDELALHVEMRTREFIERGMDPIEARRAAEGRLGDVERVRAQCRTIAEGRDRDMRRAEYFSELLQDAAFAGRQLMRNPGFTLVALLTLALGIGGTTAIFSAVYAVVLKPLPLRDPERLFVVGETFQGSPSSMSAGNYTDANAGVGVRERPHRPAILQLQPVGRRITGTRRWRTRDGKFFRRHGIESGARAHVSLR